MTCPACHHLELGIALWLCLAIAPVRGAGFVDFEATPLKAPDCIADASLSFFSQNVQPAEPPHPTLPIGRYYMIVRYLGSGSISSPVASDFGRFPPSYPWPPLRGTALTGLTPPDPKSVAACESRRCDVGRFVRVSAPLLRRRIVPEYLDLSTRSVHHSRRPAFDLWLQLRRCERAVHLRQQPGDGFRPAGEHRDSLVRALVRSACRTGGRPHRASQSLCVFS